MGDIMIDLDQLFGQAAVVFLKGNLQQVMKAELFLKQKCMLLIFTILILVYISYIFILSFFVIRMSNDKIDICGICSPSFSNGLSSIEMMLCAEHKDCHGMIVSPMRCREQMLVKDCSLIFRLSNLMIHGFVVGFVLDSGFL